MARSLKLIKTLKKQLRAEGITYRELAKRLQLSESAIKHMFASNNLSLKRMDAICEQLGLELSDLVLIAESDTPKIAQLSLEHEKELVNDMKLLLVAYCVVNYWTLDDIIGKYALSKTECIVYLARLDKMKMIELHANNHVRLLISTNFAWHRNGPIERFFRQQVQTQFFSSDFSGSGELRLVKNGDISLKSRQQLTERLLAAGELFEEISHEERNTPADNKQGTTMVLAIRQWQFQAFTALEHQ
ncbi:MAG: helix-turn-helix domain-containing protein [Arenicella sp.]